MHTLPRAATLTFERDDDGMVDGRLRGRSQMSWFRAIPGIVRLLVGLFLVAQFAGMMSSPRASAKPIAAASESHHQHGHDHGDAGKAHHHHGDNGGNLADTCCGLAREAPPLARPGSGPDFPLVAQADYRLQ
jgi:hypothetical protein